MKEKTSMAFLKWVYIWIAASIGSLLLCLLFGLPSGLCILIGLFVAIGIYLYQVKRQESMRKIGMEHLYEALKNEKIDETNTSMLVHSPSATALAVAIDGDRTLMIRCDIKNRTTDIKELYDVTSAFVVHRMHVSDHGSQADSILSGWALGGSTGAFLGATKMSGTIRTLKGLSIIITTGEEKYEFPIPLKGEEEKMRQWADDAVRLIKSNTAKKN